MQLKEERGELTHLISIQDTFVCRILSYGFDFQPGTRWLRQRFSGREKIQEVELVEGRGHSGQKTWILKFGGIDTVEQVTYAGPFIFCYGEQEQILVNTHVFFALTFSG